jgi:ribose transport system permease protein
MAIEVTLPTSEPKRHRLVAFNVRDAGTLFGLVAIAAVFSILAPDFLTPHNIINILQQSSINACVAIGMTLVIISGGIDLSVGPTAALSAVLTAMLMTSGIPLPISLLAGLAIGLACGFVNGALISYAGLQPFIVTLGTLSLYRALALIVTGGNPILGLPNGFRNLFNSDIGIVPVPVIIVAVLAALGWLLLRKAPIGEYILAVGGNEEAARVAGVPIARTKITTYMLSGALAFIAGIILIGRLGAAEPVLGNLWELDAIAASAIGGASLMGGKGSIVGTLLGALVLGAMRNGLTLMDVQAFYQLLATGIIIIAAMLVDRFTRGRA